MTVPTIIVALSDTNCLITYPVIGRELQGNFRPVLVLSPSEFNNLGTVLIAPIIQGGDFARIKGFTVSLSGGGIETQGVILINSIRMLDLETRKAKKIETVPATIVDEVLGLFNDHFGIKKGVRTSIQKTKNNECACDIQNSSGKCCLNNFP